MRGVFPFLPDSRGCLGQIAAEEVVEGGEYHATIVTNESSFELLF